MITTKRTTEQDEMNAQEALQLAMGEVGAKTCSVKVERYLSANSKCECLQAVFGTDSKGYDVWGRKVTVKATNEVRMFKTAKEACLFMAGKWADLHA